MADTEPTAAQDRCLCAERDLLGDHEEPCAGFGTRSDELCEQAEREARAAGEWPPESPPARSPLHPSSCRALLAAAEILRHVAESDTSRSKNDAAELRIAAAVCEGVAKRGS